MQDLQVSVPYNMHAFTQNTLTIISIHAKLYACMCGFKIS